MKKRQTNSIAPWTTYTLGWNLRLRNPPPHQKASPYPYFTSKLHSRKTVKAPLSSTTEFFFLPRNSKINFIRNERRCRQQRCSTQTTSNKHDHVFDNLLCIKEYPENIIEKTKRHHQRDQQTANTEWLYFKIPFILDQFDYKITRIFCREGLPVCVGHKSYMLRQALLTTLKTHA